MDGLGSFGAELILVIDSPMLNPAEMVQFASDGNE